MSSDTKRRIEADEFVLRDANGTMRAALAMTMYGPGLLFYDQSGLVRARLMVGNDEPGLALFDSLGRPRLSLGLAGDEPNVLLRDAKGNLRAAIVVDDAGTRLMLSDAKPGSRVGIATDSGEASLVFADPNGKSRVVLGMPGGGPGLTMLDGAGRQRAKLEIGDDTSTFELYDSDGKTSSSRTVVWVQPQLQAADLEAKLAVEVTARKQLEQTLALKEKYYHALTAGMAQLVWTTNAAGELIGDSQAWRDFTGQNEEETQGSGWLQALHSEDQKRVEELTKAVRETSSPYETEFRVRRQDGEYRVFAVRAVPVLRDQEGVGEWVLAATDISERRQLEEALRTSEERLSALTTADVQLQESLRVSEVSHSTERQRLEEALRASEERLSTLTAASAQLQESLRVSEASHTSERERLEDALRASEERLSTLTAASAQLQESLQASEASRTSERERLEEALRASEERLSTLTGASAQLQESLRLSEESRTSERQRLEEALRASEERLSTLTAASAQLQESLQVSEASRTSERERLEETLRASEERLSTLTAASAQLQESLQVSEVSHTTERQRLEKVLRASEEHRDKLSAANTQLQESLHASEVLHLTERRSLEETVRAGEERLRTLVAAQSRLEETLRAGEKREAVLAAAGAQLVWTTNAAGEEIDASAGWMTFTGQTIEEAKGRGWRQALHPDDRERAECVFKQAEETRRAYTTEYRLRRRDGEYRHFVVWGLPVLEDDGTIHTWIASATDITEDRQAEQLRRASEKKYRQIVEEAPEGIWMMDADHRTVLANSKMVQMLGRSEEAMQANGWFDMLDDEGCQSMADNLACCTRGMAVQYELKLRKREGLELPTRVSMRPLFDEVGQYCGVVGLIVDLTEQKRLEWQRQQAEKLRALGQLAGGVAQSLNNVLTVINGYSELLLGKVSRNDPLYESVVQIKRAGDQAAGVAAPLAAFSQGQIMRPRVLDVNELVREVEKTLRSQMGEEIRLATVLSPSLGAVKADPGQLRQVLMKLAANARDAMRSRGSLVIETQNVERDESAAARQSGVRPGPFVQITVRDSGVGMSGDTLAHLFEPYFTTKIAGQGAGLGLATAYGIIKQSGGSMRVESELGKGSTFHLYLPRVSETVGLPEEEKPAVATLRGTETILVVEDQEGIRELARAVLKGFGYKVLVAANGWEALVNSERHTGPIHLMLTDIMMPGMTGQELVERFKPLRPEMAVVFMSGYTEEPITQPGAVDAKVSFLSKPFLPDALAMKVREVLGPPRSAGKVLAIAAEEGIRTFLRVVLVSVGYDVVEVSGGEEALRELDEDGVDLILVDLETGAQGDLEKVRTLRQRHPDLKAIVIVGAFGEEFLQAAAQLGVQATLAKPIRADQLLESVRKAVGD